MFLKNIFQKSVVFSKNSRIVVRGFSATNIRFTGTESNPAIYRYKPLVSVNAVHQLLQSADQQSNGKISLLDVVYQTKNNVTEFQNEHLPNAQHFDISNVLVRTTTKIRGLAHPLDFQDYVRSLGIARDTFVILYDHGEVQKSILAATFAHWLFNVYGLQTVSIMNGGLNQWKKSNFPTESGPAKPPPEVFPEDVFYATWDYREIATISDVGSALDTHHVLDARHSEHYSGQGKVGTAHHSGRIKGAINIPTTEFIDDESGMILEGEALENLVQKFVGGSGKPVIAYCNTAFQSSGLHFVMKSAGVDSRNYDGSWVEFSHLGDEAHKESDH